MDDEEILRELLNGCGDAQPVVVEEPWADDSQPREFDDDEYEEFGDGPALDEDTWTEELFSAPAVTVAPYDV